LISVVPSTLHPNPVSNTFSELSMGTLTLSG
jgi:hypothetical protein